MKIKIDYQKPVVCVFVDGILMAGFHSDEFISFLVGYLTCLERVHVEQVYQLSFEVSRDLISGFYDALYLCSFPLSFEVRYVED